MDFTGTRLSPPARPAGVDAAGDGTAAAEWSRPRGGPARMLALAGFLLLSGGLAQAGEDYNIVIDGNAYSIGLDQEKTLTLPNGGSVSIRLSLKEYIEFESEFFAFWHKSIYKPSKTDLGDGIYQTIVTTPLGTLILFQEYTAMDPTALVDLMLRELTKEEVEYGFAYEERAVDRMVGDRQLRGKEAVTTYKDKKWTRAVYTYGRKDAGILIATVIEQGNAAQDAHLIDDLWDSLRLKN